MTEFDEDTKLLRTWRWRLQQAAKIAEAAETCAVEGCSLRIQRLLEDVEELVLDASSLVQAGIMMQHVGLNPEVLTNSTASRLETERGEEAP